LEHNRNHGDEGDLFASVAGVALSHATTPSSRNWDGADSGFCLCDISGPGEIMRFSVGEPTAKGVVASGSVTADLLIPDNLPEGIHSVIRLAEAGRVRTVKIGVDIIHPYIGDLQVELESPSGKQVLLHDRVGGSGNDLHQRWDSGASGGLQALAGDPVAGAWTLHVRDLARRDSGRLNNWHIEVEYEASQAIIEKAATQALAIPDADPAGGASRITITETGRVKDVVVSVAITHTYIGDLRVELVAPSGQRAILHNRSGGSVDNLRGTYDKNSAPGLETLVGEEVSGDWVLRVYDLALQDVGTLDAWAIRLVC
jgi:subtilisin-like proprotein convertase family protein